MFQASEEADWWMNSVGRGGKGRSLHFFRVGLPFFAIVAGGAYLLQHFQRVRYDFRRVKQVDENLKTLVRIPCSQ